MANNKYSEELFGAIDTIIEKRLQSLNKDTTILCVIDDNTDAEGGKYIVSNSGLKFDAYSDKTTYSIGQRVWVLVPDGDYENTKMIMGQYVGENSANFTWVDPLASFVDMTTNLCSEEVHNQEFGLIANHPEKKEIFYLDGESIVSEETDLTGYSRMGISVDFRTAFTKKLYAGSYGLMLTIITDKVESERNGIKQYHKEEFEFSTTSKPNGISGSVFDFKQAWTQKVAFNFNPEEIGNVTRIIVSFFQRPGSFLYNLNGNTVAFPYQDEDGVDVDPNIFISNLDIRMGFSTDQVKETTVFFSPAKDNDLEYSSFDSAENNTRYINFRIAYQLGDGTYEFINSYSHLLDFQREHDGYPKIYLYEQDLTVSNYADNRAGAGWFQQKWNQEVGFIDDSEDDNEFSGDNFWVKVILKNSGSERYKMAIAFKKDTPNADRIEEYFYALRQSTGQYSEFNGFTDNEKCAIELFLKWPYKDKEIYGDLKSDSSAPIDGTYKDENDNYQNSFMKVLKDETDEKYINLQLNDWDEDNDKWIKVSKGDILRNYLILHKEYELNGEIREKYNFLNEDYETNKGVTAFLNFLARTTLYNNYGTSENDPIDSFNLAKAEIETVYLSEPVTFKDTISGSAEAAALVQGLRLIATDDKNGIYNIYKATENANSELIKANDTYVKRSVEASFNSVITQDESLDKAEHVYWLIPKYNTMIKEPVNGTGYGKASYNLVLYTRDEWVKWYNDRKDPETGEWPTVSPGSLIEDGKNLYYLDGSEYKVVTADMLYDDIPGSASSAAKLYTKTSEILLIPENGTIPEDDDSVKKYTDELKAQLSLHEVEETFLDGVIDSYYVILEDRQEDANKTLSGKLKKASLTYQIKSTYRKSLNNNKIYVSVYRNKKIYTTSIELVFGVKGTNGTDYTLSLASVQETLKTDSGTGKVNLFPNVWTFLGENSNEDTESFVLQAAVYDINDKIVDDIVYTFSLVQGADSFELASTIHENPAIIERRTNGLTGNKYKGAIISCRAQKDSVGIDITQYYILPVRTNADFAYIDGPETVVYDTINSNPSYYNTQYSLKRTNDTDISITNVIAREAGFDNIQTDIDANGDAQYFPTIKKSGVNNDVYYLVPKATYVEDVNYDFYVEIRTNDGSWFQPILITVNKYANTSVKKIRENLVVTDEADKGTTTIMSVLKKTNDNKLTGTIIGNLPQIEIGTNPQTGEAIYKTRAGVLGYNKDEEVYGFLDDGSGFIGTETAQAKFNGDEWGLFTKAINNYEAQLMKLAEDEKYLRSLNYVTSNGTQGLSINLQTGEIIGSLSASNIPTHNHSIVDVYWNNNGNNNRVSANTVFAGPTSGQNTVPSFRQLTATDINGFNSSVTTALSNTAIGSIKIGNYTYSISVKSNEDGSLFPYSPETYSIVLTRN